MKKIVALLLSLCLVLGAASAMAAGEKIALITMDSIDQHWITLNEGAQKAAEELGRGARYFHGPQHQGRRTADRVRQQRRSRRLPGHHRGGQRPRRHLLRALKEAVDAGVKIVYVDSPANVEAEATFSTDNTGRRQDRR